MAYKFVRETGRNSKQLASLLGMENVPPLKDQILERYGSLEGLERQAKIGKDGYAKELLAFAYIDGVPELEIPKDSEKAIGWLEEWYKSDETPLLFPGSIHQLAVLHDLKETIPHRRRAYELYHKAAELGYTKSELNLAEIYFCGIDGVVDEDITEAFVWYKRVAGEDVGRDKGQLNAFQRMTEGTLRSICGKDDKITAHRRLFELYKEGQCPEKVPQPLKAFYYLSRAAEMGDPEAQRDVGCICLKGGCRQRKDLDKAKRWLTKAAESGDSKAREMLNKFEEEGVIVDMSKHAAAPKHSMNEAADIIQQIFPVVNPENEPHPLLIKNPVIFQESMFLQYPNSTTAQNYLKAYKLVKEGIELFYRSGFKDPRGITLMAQGFLYENSILQSFRLLITEDFHIAILHRIHDKADPKFFEGLLMLTAFSVAEKKFDLKSQAIDKKKIMSYENLIHLIKKAEPNWQPELGSPYQFEKGYGKWLHVLYYFLASLYTVADCNEWGADAFQKSLDCCPGYYEAKEGLGYCLMNIRSSKVAQKMKKKENEKTSYSSDNEKFYNQFASKTELTAKTDYSAWSVEKLSKKAKELFLEYLKEAPICDKKYPNCCYHLAQLYAMEENLSQCRVWWERGQDAEAKRLPFLQPVDIPHKKFLSFLDILPLPQDAPRPKCSNRSCLKPRVTDEALKNCPCKKAAYCDKECQKEDWAEHKKTCASAKNKRKK